VRRLTAGEIRRLQTAGIDVHELKGGGRTGLLDLFKDENGAIYVMMEDGPGRAGAHRPQHARVLEGRSMNEVVSTLEQADVQRTATRAFFRVIGFACSPDELSNAIGLQPTRTWNEGDLVTSRSTRRQKSSGWELASGLAKEATPDQHASRLLDRLGPAADSLKRMPVEASVLSIVLEIHGGDRPPLGLSRENVARLAALGAELDIDLYVFD
jgi:hypothetical protein